MHRKYLSKALRAKVAARAKGLCEYCKCLQKYCPDTFACEHIIALILGGTDDLENLAQACGGCNGAKHMAISALDPVTNQVVALFNPRQDEWSEHFKWSTDLLEIEGLTPTGRVAITRLKMNRPALMNLRSLLKITNEHPPK